MCTPIQKTTNDALMTYDETHRIFTSRRDRKTHAIPTLMDFI
jgi:hypothetical protein